MWAATVQKTLPLLYYPGTYPQVAFGHLMGGYDASLYSYPWARVYAQDLFTAFSTAPTLLDAQVGMRYRTEILAPARTYEPDAEVRNFLGRPMHPNAFYTLLGIAPSPSP
jgi:Zn-dependent oligopeptidase